MDVYSARVFLESHGYTVVSPDTRFLKDSEEGGSDSLPMSEMYFFIGGVVVCMLTAALAAGLTMGLLSIDPLKLAIKQKCGSDEEKRMAASILPILSQHHLLLVTLLLMNAAANEALPLFLDELVPSYVAIILSVTIVLFFGEIFPSAIFTGPNQLRYAYYLSPVVKFLMLILRPITYPIAKGLDYALGHEHEDPLNRKELTALVQIQYENGSRSTTDGRKRSAINYDEVQMVTGALAITTQTAADAMVKMSKVYSLPETAVMDSDMMVSICAAGHSRIPIYHPDPLDASNRNLLTGFLLAKKLVALDTTSPRPVSSLMLRSPLCVSPTRVLSDLLNDFQSASTHLAVVCLKPELASSSLARDQPIPKECKVLGIITMEDIIEELLQEEILDETDRWEAMAMKRAKKVVRKWKAIVRKRRLARGEEVSKGMLSIRDVADVAMEARSAGEPDEEMGEETLGDSGKE
eukprot:CAMPEP_0118652254 /NCGR_PEP_ID=MMETSP0785-20121206/11219_1 /TAXON_ID=91992 /ORGANISM="Bolidomonas pacifica, Strain CCMP 1866" /LENGTH=464 /DNA_ID=CAMNT_0006544757 /DNA_START=151 /DNA_END=1542 /DNA_ORIENTATION=+